MFHKAIYKLINTLARKIKGDSYSLDESIPINSLLAVSIRRSLMLLRAILFFYSPMHKLFLGKGVTIRNRIMLRLGKGVTLGDYVLIDSLSKNGVLLGDNVNIGEYTRIEASGSITDIGKGISIGNNSGIGSFSFIGGAGGVEIGQDVIMGQMVSFHPENHNFDALDIPIRLQGVWRQGITIGDDCWIGVKVTFLDGARVGKGCVIAAGSIVRGDIPEYSVVAGVPAKVIKSRRNKNNE